MNCAIHSTAIAGLLVLLIAGTSQAQIVPISNCTTISTPGSYIVTRNITATPSNVGNARACIVITADFVTLNLFGFAVTGTSNLTFTVNGISTDFVDHHGIYVHTGTVANFPDSGVILFGSGHTVENIRVVNNGQTGIVLRSSVPFGTPEPPSGHRIVGNTAILNGGNGIAVQCPSVVLKNAADGNGTGTAAEQIFEVPFPTSPSPCTRAENNPTP